MHIFYIFRDGDSMDSKVLKKLSGGRLPESVQTTTGAAHLLFTSDATGNRTGFELQWEPAVAVVIEEGKEVSTRFLLKFLATS